MSTYNDEVKSIIISGGNATIINIGGEIVDSPSSVLRDNKVIVPRNRIDLFQTRDILVNSGTIRFEENTALLNFVIQKSINRTVMSQLGKIAESIIVKRCFESEDVKYRLFCIATGKRARKETARQFEACGTSLIDTKISHLRHYNPQDTQRDIIFINSFDKVAFMSNATSVAGECAGLQVKTSNDIINYIIGDIINSRYCVPIICFPLMIYQNTNLMDGSFNQEIVNVNIYDLLIQTIVKNERYKGRLIENNQNYCGDYLNTNSAFEDKLYDFLHCIVYDINDIDTVAFGELLYIKDILELLVYGRITPDDLLRESDVLKSYFMSIGLESVSPSVEYNNILASSI